MNTLVKMLGINIVTLNYACHSVSGQNVAVRPASMPQVVQFPMQQTIPVQVPISTANGQTLYQTIHFPVQAFATAIPNIIQASSGQVQMIPQLSQVCGFSVANTTLMHLHFVVVRTGSRLYTGKFTISYCCILSEKSKSLPGIK